MSTILDKIVATKLGEIQRAQAELPMEDLQRMVQDAPAARDFFAALSGGETVRLIAEVKKASPSKGIIREDFDPVQIAQTYQTHGASCLSVLTDQTYFQGSLDILRQVRQQVQIPILRKDFVLDAYQVFEARAAGADAVLLIAECLDDDQLKRLYDLIVQLDMTPLVEYYEPQHLPRILELGTKLIGINNRDLHTFETDLHHSIRQREQIPSTCLVVGESGIESREDVLLLQNNGVNAILVGESLMKSPDIAAAVRHLLGT